MTPEEFIARAKRLGVVLYHRADGTYIMSDPLEADDEEGGPDVVEFNSEVSLNDYLNGFEHAAEQRP